MKTNEYPRLLLKVFAVKPKNFAEFLSLTKSAFDTHFEVVHEISDEKIRKKAVAKVMKKASKKFEILYKGYQFQPALTESCLRSQIGINKVKDK